jgi:hypothetical protein
MKCSITCFKVYVEHDVFTDFTVVCVNDVCKSVVACFGSNPDDGC